jgi:hypothetical protein
VSTVFGLKIERVLSMQNCLLERPLDQRVIQRSTGDSDIVPLLVKMLKTLAG